MRIGKAHEFLLRLCGTKKDKQDGEKTGSHQTSFLCGAKLSNIYTASVVEFQVLKLFQIPIFIGISLQSPIAGPSVIANDYTTF